MTETVRSAMLSRGWSEMDQDLIERGGVILSLSEEEGRIVLNMIFVNQEVRGTGAGRGIIQELISIAARRGKRLITTVEDIGISPDGHSNIRFYEKSGMHAIGTDRHGRVLMTSREERKNTVDE